MKEFSLPKGLKGRAVEQTTNGIVITRQDSTGNNPIVYVNPAFERITGYSPEEVKGRDCRFLQGKDINQDGLKEIRQTLKARQSCEVVLRNYRKDGSLFYNELQLSPIFTEDGQLDYYIGVINDITARKQAEMERETLIHDIGERIKELNCLYSVSKIIRKNTSFDQILQETVNQIPSSSQWPDVTEARIQFNNSEYSTESFKPTPWCLSCDIETNGRVRGRIEVCYTQQKPEQNEGYFLKEEKELLEGLARMLGDAAEKKESDQRMRQQSGFLSNVIESLPHPFYVLDASNYKILLANKAAKDLNQGANITTCFELTHGTQVPCAGEDHLCPLEEIHQNKKPIVVEHTHQDGQGNPAIVEVHACPILDEKGQLNQVIEYIIDITERKHAEQNLAASEKKYRQLIETANSIIIRIDKTGTITFVNDYALKFFGYKDNELVGKDVMTLLPRVEKTTGRNLKSLIKNVLAYPEKYTYVPNENITKDGRIVWVAWSNKPITDEDGNVTEILAIGNDITELKEAENKLQWIARRDELLSQTAAKLLSSKNPQTVVEELCREVMKFLDCQIFFNFLWEEKTGQLHLNTWAGIDKNEAYNIEKLDCGGVTTVARRRKRIIVEDVQNSADQITEPIKSYGLLAYCCHPLIVDRTLIGTLSFGTRTRIRFDPKEIEVMKTVSDLVAVTMSRIAVQQKLARSEERYALAQAAASTGSWDWDIVAGTLEWSDQVGPIFGLPLGQDPGTYENFLSYVHPEDRQPVQDYVNKSLKTCTDFSIEHRIIRKSDGELRWLLETGRAFCDKSGKPIRMAGVVQDITERKISRRQLYESEEKFRDFFENAPVGVHIFGPDKIIQEMNDYGLSIIGYKREEIVGKKTWADLVIPQQRRKFERHWKTLLEKGRVRSLEYTLLHKNGNPVYVLLNASAKFEDGQILHTRGSFLNITRRKHAEEEIKSIARFPDENLSPILRISNQGTVLYSNRAGKPLLKKWNCRVGATLTGELKELFTNTLAERHIRTVETECDDRVFALTISPIPGSDYVNIYAHDITERRAVEREREQLLRTLAAKNEELESILYVASHDLRSPLVNIQGFSQELSRCCKDLRDGLDQAEIDLGKVAREADSALNEGIPEALSFILASTTKIDVLLAGLLRLSRLGRAAPNIRKLDMNMIMADVVKNLEYKIQQSGTEVVVDKLPDCAGDSAQINQVFTNLVDNSLKFLDKTRKGFVHIYGKIEQGQSIYCVEDNGLGVAPAYQEKIFETFHRLEPERTSGEGLGLTIVRRIVDRHGGRVWVESEPGKGSKFYVALTRE